MDIQQIITLAVVAVASVYLWRVGRVAWKAMWSGRSGCGSGCAKCVSAEISQLRRRQTVDDGRQTADDRRRTTVIPLSAVSGVPVHRPPSTVYRPPSADE